jgi:hypothetical protein
MDSPPFMAGEKFHFVCLNTNINPTYQVYICRKLWRHN